MSIKKDFDIAQSLYISAFPKDERRPIKSITELLQEDYFEFIPLYTDNEFVGFATLWMFEKFAYLEHFAIRPEKRNGGIGFAFIKALQENSIKDSKLIFTLPQKTIKNIVIEVEKPDNEIARKRIGFYERLGFKILDNYYFQPPYSKENSGLEMKVMT